MKDADGWESCNDDIESHQAGDDKFCSLADVIDLDSFAAHAAGETDGRQSVAKGYLRLHQRRGKIQKDERRRLRQAYSNLRKVAISLEFSM